MKLRNLEKKDAVYMYSWMTDPDMYRNFQFDPTKITLEGCEKYIEDSNQEEKNKHFAIADDDDIYLGTISIKNIDKKNKNGEYAIAVRKEYHGQGVAEFATKALLQKSFNELELNKVYLNVLSENTRAIRFYEKMGFIYEGEFREHLCVNDTYKNLKWFGILKEDFEREGK